MGEHSREDLDSALGTLLSAPASPLTDRIREEIVDLLCAVERLLFDRSIGDAPPEVLTACWQLRAALTCHLTRTGPPVAEPDPLSPLERLRALVMSVTADPSVHLGDTVAPEGAAALWEWLHLQCLRLPRELARSVRRAAAALFDPGHLGGPGDLVVPPCPALDYLGWDREPIRQEVYDQVGDVFAEYGALGDILIDVLAVAQRCGALRTGHSGWASQTLEDLASPERLVMHRRMVLDLLRPRKADSATTLAFKHIVSCDEAIRSIFPWPLPAQDSWWSEQGRRSAELVRTVADQQGVRLTILSGSDAGFGPAASTFPRDVGWVNATAPDGQDEPALWQLRLGYQLGEDHPTAGATARALRVRTQ